MKERWGKSVFHCPYCDGYEIGGGAIGVLATLPLSIHFAKLITDWGNVTLFTNKAIALDGASRQSLVKKGVRIEELPIAKLEGNAPDILNTVVLNDGTELRIKALFIATLFRMATPFAKDLGCELIESPRGTIVKTDESKMTSVAGVYAAGDMARLTHSIPCNLGWSHSRCQRASIIGYGRRTKRAYLTGFPLFLNVVERRSAIGAAWLGRLSLTSGSPQEGRHV